MKSGVFSWLSWSAPWRALSLGRALSLASGVALCASGCGRKATVDDCQQIVKRIVELELQSVVPQQELSSEVVQAQQTFKERALSDCVGKRITDKSLACVAAAKDSKTIIDDCF
jgi:hypothetical protein